MYIEYERYLISDFSDDYWSDLGILEAAELLSSFNSVDWDLLSREVGSKPHLWQERCAETLSETDAPQAFDALIKLIFSDEKEIVVAAADSLNSLLSMGYKINVPKEMGERLVKFKPLVGLTGKLVIEALEKKII